MKEKIWKFLVVLVGTIVCFWLFLFILIPFHWLSDQVIGPYRSGKSFLLNQLLSLSCYEGAAFFVICLTFFYFFFILF